MNNTILYFKNFKPLITNANYLYGVPNLDSTFVVAFIPDQFGIHFKNANTDQEKFYLNKNDIQSISIEDQSTIETRIGFKRLLLVGLFAFAWKKRKNHPLSFLIFTYKNEFGETQEMFIQSDNKNGFQDFTNLKYNIQKFWKEAELNPHFEEQMRLIEKHKHADQKYKNAIILVAVIAIFILAYIAK